MLYFLSTLSTEDFKIMRILEFLCKLAEIKELPLVRFIILLIAGVVCFFGFWVCMSIVSIKGVGSIHEVYLLMREVL